MLWRISFFPHLTHKKQCCANGNCWDNPGKKYISGHFAKRQAPYHLLRAHPLWFILDQMVLSKVWKRLGMVRFMLLM